MKRECVTETKSNSPLKTPQEIQIDSNDIIELLEEVVQLLQRIDNKLSYLSETLEQKQLDEDSYEEGTTKPGKKSGIMPKREHVPH